MQSKTLHGFAALLHGALAAVVVAVLFVAKPGRGSFPVFFTEPRAASTGPVYDVESRKVGDMSLPALLLAFCVVTCGFHAVRWAGVSFPGIQWAEYAITAPLMIVIIAVLSGVRSADTFSLLACMMAAVMYFGYAAEKQRGTGARATGTLASGWLLYLPIWAVIAVTFFTHIHRANDLAAESDQVNGQAPWWLWMILLAEFALFSCFGVVPFLEQGRGWSPGQTERVYVALSFVSKGLLVGLLTGGLAMEQKELEDAPA